MQNIVETQFLRLYSNFMSKIMYRYSKDRRKHFRTLCSGWHCWINGLSGAGLGLSITKSLCRDAWWKKYGLKVKREGSTFYFRSYNIEPDEIIVFANTFSSEETPPKIKPLKILIVEDDEGSAMLISLNIAKFSKRVFVCRKRRWSSWYLPE